MALALDALDDLVGFFGDLAVYVLALLVIFVDMLGLFDGGREVPLYQQVESLWFRV